MNQGYVITQRTIFVLTESRALDKLKFSKEYSTCPFLKKGVTRIFLEYRLFVLKNIHQENKAISTARSIAPELNACIPSLLTREQTVRLQFFPCHNRCWVSQDKTAEGTEGCGRRIIFAKIMQIAAL